MNRISQNERQNMNGQSFLVAVGPAGDFEAFVDEVGDPTTEPVPPVLTGPPPAEVVERVVTGAQRHNIEIHLPPNGAP